MSDPSGVTDRKRDGDAAVENDQTLEEALRLGLLVPPGGYALVAGAVDWRRGGMSAPVPASLLPVLAAPHLTERAEADLADHGTYEAALQWATRDISPGAALLRRDETGSYTVSDYALDLFSRQDEPIPQATWPVLIENATPRDLVGVGYTAEVVYSLSEIALQAWRNAADSGHDDYAPAAAGNLGQLLWQQGDVLAAQAAFEQAINSGHADHAPAAARDLGAMLWQQGDAKGARAAFEKAVKSRHADHAPPAAVLLGKLLWEDDAEGAQAAFEQAVNSGHTDHAPEAAVWLGVLFQQQGDVRGARAAFEQAVSSGHADHAPLAAGNLGELLWQQGELEGARAAFEQTVDSGYADLASVAAIKLGTLLGEQGDVQGARAAFEKAINSGSPEAAEEARERSERLLPEDFLRDVRRAARSARERRASSGSIRNHRELQDSLIEALAYLEAGATAVASARFGDVVSRNHHAGDNQTAEIVAEAGAWWLACQQSRILPTNADEINRFLLDLVDRGGLHEHCDSALQCLKFASLSLAHPAMYLEDQWRSNVEFELAKSHEPERFRADYEQGFQYCYEFVAQSADLAASVIANRIANGAPLMLWLRSFSAEALSSPMKQSWSPMGQHGWMVRVMYPEAHELESVLVRLNEDLPFVTAALPILTGVSLSAPAIPRIRLRNEYWLDAVSGLIDVCDGIVVLIDNRRSPSLLSELHCIHQRGAVGKTVALIPQNPPHPSVDLFGLLASRPADDDAQHEEMSQLLEPIQSIPLSDDYASAAAAVQAAFGERWGFLEDLRPLPWQDRVRARMRPAK